MACGAGTRLPAEKKSIHATERDTDENRLRRISFRAELETIPPECLVYLDESGVSTQMTRTLARARRGQRIHDAVPAGHWKILTIVGALSIRGMLASMTVEAATDGDVFFAFLDHFLCPKLRPGDVLVMDNLSVHKVEGVRQRVEAAPACSTCRPIRPTSIPSKRRGPSSRLSCAAKRHGRQKPFTTQSNAAYQPSPLRTHKLGSDSRSQYSYEETALGAAERR
jgi:DDE superfamily endonuclease